MLSLLWLLHHDPHHAIADVVVTPSPPQLLCHGPHHAIAIANTVVTPLLLQSVFALSLSLLSL
jgi:hypothetical protein